MSSSPNFDSDDSHESNQSKLKASRKRKLDSDDDFDPENVDGKILSKPPSKKQAGPSKRKTPIKKPPKIKPTEKAPRKPRAPNKKKPLPVPKNEVKTDVVLGMEWDVADYLAQLQEIDVRIASNIIRLLCEENTIPFIARYRKELTGDMSPEKLREVKEAYEILENVKHKANTVMTNISKLGKLTPILERSILCSRTISELDHIYAPFKPGSKRTLAERARQLGLEPIAMAVLEGSEMVSLFSKVQPGKEGLSTIEEVELGVKHIIADIISKDRLVLEKLREIKEYVWIKLESCKARTTTKQSDNSEAQKQKPNKKNLQSNIEKKPKEKTKEELEGKFENYYNFSIPIKYIKPHQVLAVNRGENLKILSVKIVIPDLMFEKISQFCYSNWLANGLRYPLRSKLVDESIKDAYTRLVQPLVTRQVRADLNHSAVRAAVEVFATNLKNLLLSPPLRGSTILGIDPGFRNGCKLAITSQSGDVLHTDVMYPRFGQDINPHHDPNACKLKDLLLNFNCELIALGNGTACRETEAYLSHLIQNRWFTPLDVTYTIVSEQGASIYSCSPEAKKEFPDLDANLISAVSLARRVQDPLGELVKVEPKHLGVGMYQHDVPEKQLSTTLDDVVVECVSFVGVDVNTASHSILRRVAGLNQARADNILQWRSEHCSFQNRKQLLKVKGIGAKTFQQCAGFIRIIPETVPKQSESGNTEKVPTGKSRAKKAKLEDDCTLNPLDRTWIHPESYSVASKFVNKCEVDLENLGTPDFIQKVKNTVLKIGLSALATELEIDEPAMKLISDGLQQTPGHDLRSQFQQPLFRRGLTSINDLTPGTILTGRVQNVTHFGVFVDIGVGINGLIPASKLRNASTRLGDRVEVKVHSIEIQRKRISLELIQVL